jgi:hypothetical protein
MEYLSSKGTENLIYILDFYLYLLGMGPRHSWSGYSLAYNFGGPGSRPGLENEISGGESGVGAGFLRVLRFPLPKPFISPSSPSSSSQSTGQLAESLRRADHPSKEYC